MSDIKDLPQGEFEVMDVLWQRGEATVKEVLAVLSKDRKLAYTTVATLLTRLKDKGYVSAEERNFAYVFKPLVQRDRVVKRKLDDMVKHILGGRLAPLAAYIAENRNLTPEQIALLEDIAKSEAGKED
jgi:predicted transcriptional regulator